MIAWLLRLWPWRRDPCPAEVEIYTPSSSYRPTLELECSLALGHGGRHRTNSGTSWEASQL